MEIGRDKESFSPTTSHLQTLELLVQRISSSCRTRQESSQRGRIYRRGIRRVGTEERSTLSQLQKAGRLLQRWRRYLRQLLLHWSGFLSFPRNENIFISPSSSALLGYFPTEWFQVPVARFTFTTVTSLFDWLQSLTARRHCLR